MRIPSPSKRGDMTAGGLSDDDALPTPDKKQGFNEDARREKMAKMPINFAKKETATELPRYRATRTLALLMGVGTMERTAARLRETGHPADLPVAVVASAGRREEGVVRTTLAGVVDAIGERGVRAPAVVLVGRVAAPRTPTSTRRRILHGLEATPPR